jgi:hypothetical protein
LGGQFQSVAQQAEREKRTHIGADTKTVSAAEIAQLATGDYIERSEPVLLIGDCDPATLCTSLLHH